MYIDNMKLVPTNIEKIYMRFHLFLVNNINLFVFQGSTKLTKDDIERVFNLYDRVSNSFFKIMLTNLSSCYSTKQILLLKSTNRAS